LDEADPEPLWSQQAAAMVAAAKSRAIEKRLVLVGHSGATATLPAAGERLSGAVAGYVLVDGPLPQDGLSHLEMMRIAMPPLAAAVELTLSGGGRFPDVLAQERSSEQAGIQVTASPRGRRFFEESVRVPVGWPDAPSAYIALGPDPGAACLEASERGWPTRTLSGHHFLIVTQPEMFTKALLDLTGEASTIHNK
jgi:hypothetical protein